MQITVDQKDILFHVQYSSRKKLTLEVSPEGHITVKAPLKTPVSEINDFIFQNSKSLLKVQERLEKREYVSSQKSYEDQSNFLYLGKICKLEDILDSNGKTEEEIQSLLKKYYTAKTKEYVTARVAYYEPLIGVKSRSITVVNSPHTWGTCNSHKELTFNYRLSMADPGAIDYVVIHELCHLIHLNHDRAFWRKLGAFDKNYKMNQDYLSRLGPYMTI